MTRTLLLAWLLILAGVACAQQATARRPAITGISHMSLYADDLAKSQQFYSSLLGWVQSPAGGVQSGVRFYANHLQYIELISPPSQGLENRLQVIGFSTSDAEALRRFLAANGVTVPLAVGVEKDGSKIFQVNDPEGNKIDFVQAGTTAPKAPKSEPLPLSGHIIHAGFVAHDRAVLDHFYKDLLGFHLYWQGGSAASHTDWVMMQVPDGTDWLEYMLYLPADPSRDQLGSANHFSPGVVSVAKLAEQLKARRWVPSEHERLPLLGLDGKWQLDLVDPDGTRVEFMEFEPAKEPCCAPFTGPQPRPAAGW